MTTDRTIAADVIEIVAGPTGMALTGDLRRPGGDRRLIGQETPAVRARAVGLSARWLEVPRPRGD